MLATTVVAIGAGIGIGSIAAGCSDTPERTVAAYCAAVGADLQVLMNPAIATGADIDATIDRYRSIAEVAPAQVEPEWQRVIEVLETAATVIPGDQASLELANQAALAGAPAYVEVQQYTQQQCALDVGTPPTPTNPVTATTVVPPTTLPTLGG
ncbi:MAG: hypothetical protein NTZ21_17950 [Actinobacteria bacterium]|nr:hypothetical protein [Actinomycetota bacterium]